MKENQVAQVVGERALLHEPVTRADRRRVLRVFNNGLRNELQRFASNSDLMPCTRLDRQKLAVFWEIGAAARFILPKLSTMGPIPWRSSDNGTGYSMDKSVGRETGNDRYW